MAYAVMLNSYAPKDKSTTDFIDWYSLNEVAANRR
jgi:hypothetical protein